MLYYTVIKTVSNHVPYTHGRQKTMQEICRPKLYVQITMLQNISFDLDLYSVLSSRLT